jgi:hypothetical protein
MPTRRRRRIAAVAAALVACCLAFSAWIVVRGSDAGSSRAVSSVLLEPRKADQAAPAPGRPHTRPAMLSGGPALAACELRIEHQAHRLPTVAIVGASYTAGIGPGSPQESWAAGLARLLHWNAVIYGVPGVGYARTGAGGRGPMSRMLSQAGLQDLSPALVLVQAGHDDIGVPVGLEGQRVRATVDQIRAAAPGARIGLLTAFASSPGGSPALRETNRAIVTAGTAADPGVIVMDPLAGHWTFPRAGRGALHPTAGGDAWIAGTVAGILRAHGVRPAARGPAAPVICNVSVGTGRPAGAA